MINIKYRTDAVSHVISVVKSSNFKNVHYFWVDILNFGFGCIHYNIKFNLFFIFKYRI